jgi:hypothetical protein
VDLGWLCLELLLGTGRAGFRRAWLADVLEAREHILKHAHQLLGAVLRHVHHVDVEQHPLGVWGVNDLCFRVSEPGHLVVLALPEPHGFLWTFKNWGFY